MFVAIPFDPRRRRPTTPRSRPTTTGPAVSTRAQEADVNAVMERIRRLPPDKLLLFLVLSETEANLADAKKKVEAAKHAFLSSEALTDAQRAELLGLLGGPRAEPKHAGFMRRSNGSSTTTAR
jgi:hypothetical protein